MSVRSMTGFARVTRQLPEGELVFTVKSVNHRGLDVHFHVPAEMEQLETDLRGLIKNGVARGHLQVNISYSRAAAGAAAQFNRELLDSYFRAFREAAEHHHVDTKPDLNAALSLPGMLSGAADREIDECVTDGVLDAAREAISALNAFREREGAATAAEISQRARAICGLVDRMQEIRAGAVPEFQKRLREKLADLLQGVSVDPQRLAQEAAILADRSDISEELLRLRTHTEQLEQMLG